MDNVIEKIEFDRNELIISGTLEQDDVYIKLIIRQRITNIDLVIPKEVFVLPEVRNRQFTFKINMEIYSDILYKSNIWDLLLKIGETTSTIDMGKLNTLNASYVKLSNSVYEAKPYITAKNKLAIWIKQGETYDVDDLNIKCSEEKVCLSFKSNNNYLKNNISNAKICFRRRELKELELYSDEACFSIYKNDERGYTSYIGREELAYFQKGNSNQIWDCYLKIKYDDDFIQYEHFKLNDYNTIKNEFIQVFKNVLINGSIKMSEDRLQLVIIQNNIHVKVKDIDYCENSEVSLLCNIDHKDKKFKINKLIILKRIVGDSLTKEYEVEIPIKIDEEGFYTKFSLVDAVDSFFKEDNIAIDIFIELIDDEHKYVSRIPISIKENEKLDFKYCNIKNTNFSIKPYKTKINTLAFYMRKIMKNYSVNPIKLAILGSCYSRSAFVSLDYLNPFYKEKYEIVYTQFHSSIPSSMSKPIKYDEDYFIGLADTHKEYVKCDFEKTMFESLDIAKPDYIIMDLYADAVRDLIVFDDEHIITGSFLIKDSKYLHSIGDKATVISHEYKEAFLNYWIPAVDKFIQKIKKSFPENKIIIQKARMTDKYYNKNKDIKIFDNDRYLVRRSNYYFEIMENYILNKMPNIQVIDLNKFNYIGDEKFPYGQSTNHYQSEYYKELVKQLDNIVLKDRCN